MVLVNGLMRDNQQEVVVRDQFQQLQVAQEYFDKINVGTTLEKA